MAAATGAVIAAGVAIKGSLDAKKAQKSAAKEQEQAARLSASTLAQAGADADADILQQQALAEDTVEQGAMDSVSFLKDFIGTGAFDAAQAEIMSGAGITGPLADTIRRASTEFITSRPNLFDIGGPVGDEVSRQADLSVSQISPLARQNLITAAQQEIAATGDVAGIEQRKFQRLADIAGGSGAQRASVLVGQTPQLADLQSTAQQSRLLSDVAGQRSRTETMEALAGAAGEIFEGRR